MLGKNFYLWWRLKMNIDEQRIGISSYYIYIIIITIIMIIIISISSFYYYYYNYIYIYDTYLKHHI